MFGGSLSVFYKHVEVSLFREGARVQQFKFSFEACSIAVCLYQLILGVASLGVFIKVLHVGVSGSAVQVEVIFFNVFSVIAL